MNLKELCREARISQRALAREAGFHETSICHAVVDASGMSQEKCHAVGAILVKRGVDPVEVDLWLVASGHQPIGMPRAHLRLVRALSRALRLRKPLQQSLAAAIERGIDEFFLSPVFDIPKPHRLELDRALLVVQER